MGPSSPSELERLRGVARLGAALGEPASLHHLATRVCQLALRLLAADGAALWIGDPGELVSSLGPADWPLAPPESDQPVEDQQAAPAAIDLLRAWAAARPMTRLELVPLILDGQRAGMLALATSELAPFSADLTETLGATVSLALMHLRSTSELAEAYRKQDREHEALLRAERMRALGDMALGIAHDFNNVLNAMVAQLGVLAGMLGAEHPAAAVVDKLSRIARDGATTVSRVQDFSGERRDQDFADVELADVVAHTLARLRPPPQVQIDLVVSARPRVAGNAAELGEVVRALAGNAIEAMPSGGRLKIELGAAEDQASLLISDDGVGMSAHVRRRAFDPFFTTKGSRIKGLGLSVSYGIVRRHGGYIELESAPAQGTRVRVLLPALPAAAVALEPARAPEVRSVAGGRRVLLVEDDPDNRDAMESLLQLSGFEVVTANSGSAAVTAFAPERFDVVVTDLGLPDMDGWRVAAAIKQLAPVPVALITGWGLNLDSSEIHRRGVDLLVKKPLDPRGFLAQIENLLAR